MKLLFAYIDPGAGSLLIQGLIATLLSIPFFFRNAIRSTVAKFRRKPQAVDSEGQAPVDPE